MQGCSPPGFCQGHNTTNPADGGPVDKHIVTGNLTGLWAFHCQGLDLGLDICHALLPANGGPVDPVIPNSCHHLTSTREELGSVASRDCKLCIKKL